MAPMIQRDQPRLPSPLALNMHDTALQPASPLCVAAFSDAGVMVLSSSMRILHINGQAQELMGLFGEAHGFLPHLSPESMPAILTEFCGKILAELDRGGDHRNWTEFETCRVCHMVTPALLLRGFGIPAEDGREHRMILTLQPCHPSTGLPERQEVPDSSNTFSDNLASSLH